MLYTHKVGGSNPSSPTMHAQRPRTIPRPFSFSCWAYGYGPYALNARRTPSMHRIRSERNVRCIRIVDGPWARILTYNPRWNCMGRIPFKRLLAFRLLRGSQTHILAYNPTFLPITQIERIRTQEEDLASPPMSKVLKLTEARASVTRIILQRFYTSGKASPRAKSRTHPSQRAARFDRPPQRDLIGEFALNAAQDDVG